MAHTRKAAILIIDELQEKLKNQDIALAKRLEWIGKVEAQKADLLAALKEMLATFNRYTVPSAALGSSAADADRVREQARAAIERNS